MQTGTLRNRIEIQKLTRTRDSLGGIVETWARLVEVWANVRMSGAGERMISSVDQEVALVTHRITIRHRTDVSVENRILHGDRVLDIESAVDPDGRRRELVLVCSERVGEEA